LSFSLQGNCLSLISLTYLSVFVRGVVDGSLSLLFVLLAPRKADFFGERESLGKSLEEVLPILNRPVTMVGELLGEPLLGELLGESLHESLKPLLLMSNRQVTKLLRASQLG
jgi:hypothetical protein